jgi:hypothetical protein
MTYRERRLARAERLREWSDKRETKAADAFGAAERMAGVIPFGQPILVGHHSESRDRRYRDRISRNMDKGVEHSRKAESMASRADSIEQAVDRAIYSDDPDAIERLETRLGELETERETVKAERKAARNEHREPLFPAYVLGNLGGNITRLRKRVAQLRHERDHGPQLREIVARYRGACDKCGGVIEPGNRILYAKGHAEHADCP